MFLKPMLFIEGVVALLRGVASIFYRIFFWSLNSLFSLDLCCVCLLSTFCLSRICQYVTKRERKVFNFFYLEGDEIVFESGRKEKKFF